MCVTWSCLTCPGGVAPSFLADTSRQGRFCEATVCVTTYGRAIQIWTEQTEKRIAFELRCAREGHPKFHNEDAAKTCKLSLS